MNQTTGSLWVVYALLSALFAASTSILAKIGINGMDSNLATAIRTVVVLVMAWGLVFMTGVQKQISNIGARSWLFLVLSAPLPYICAAADSENPYQAEVTITAQDIINARANEPNLKCP